VAAAAMSSGGLAVADASLDPADCSWVAVAKASAQTAVKQLPECLARWASCWWLVADGWGLRRCLHARPAHTGVLQGQLLALRTMVPTAV
jgi:hypothetical protein